MRKILIIADSLAMPRPGVTYEETWPYKLTQQYRNDHFIYRFQRSSLISRLNIEGGNRLTRDAGSDCLEFFDPDIIILQLGITECAPRLFSTLENKIFKLLHLTNYFRWWREKYSYRKPEKAITPIDKFREQFDMFLKRADKNGLKKLLVILIAPSTESFRKLSPHVQKQIDLYNNGFKEVGASHSFVDFLEPLSLTEMEKFALDEWHFGTKGHAVVANKLIEKLK